MFGHCKNKGFLLTGKEKSEAKPLLYYFFTFLGTNRTTINLFSYFYAF